MSRRVVTSEDVQSAKDSELRLPAGAIVTDRAREMAAERGVKLQIEGTASGAVDGAEGKRSDDRVGRVVALGSDHGGYELKEYLKRFLSESGYKITDLGTNSAEAVDYPDFARAVGEAVAEQRAWRGIMIDSAGIGSAMAANKVPGVRAALCYDRATARNSREHNDANVLTLGARLIAPELAREVAAVWLETQFAGGRHQKRVDKIIALEQRTRRPPETANAAGSSASAGPSREQLIEAVTREVLCRLGDQQACALRGLEIDDAVCPGCDGHCAESCPQKSRRVVAAARPVLVRAPAPPRFPLTSHS